MNCHRHNPFALFYVSVCALCATAVCRDYVMEIFFRILHCSAVMCHEHAIPQARTIAYGYRWLVWWLWLQLHMSHCFSCFITWTGAWNSTDACSRANISIFMCFRSNENFLDILHYKRRNIETIFPLITANLHRPTVLAIHFRQASLSSHRIQQIWAHESHKIRTLLSNITQSVQKCQHNWHSSIARDGHCNRHLALALHCDRRWFSLTVVNCIRRLNQRICLVMN